jgi:hypothetical protein
MVAAKVFGCGSGPAVFPLASVRITLINDDVLAGRQLDLFLLAFFREMGPELSINSAGADRAWALDLYKKLGSRPCDCIERHPTPLDVPPKSRGEESILRCIDPEAVKSAGRYKPEELTVCPQQSVAASDVEQPITIAPGGAPRASNTIEHGEKILSDVEQTAATNTAEGGDENMGDVEQTVALAPGVAPGASETVEDSNKAMGDVEQPAPIAPREGPGAKKTLNDCGLAASDVEQPTFPEEVPGEESVQDLLARAHKVVGWTSRDEAARRRMSL